MIITVTLWQVDEELSWSLMKPDIFAIIMDFFASGQQVVSGEQVMEPGERKEGGRDGWGWMEGGS